MLPAAAAPVMYDARAGVRGDHVAPGRVGPADLVEGGVLDPDAVADVAGVAGAEQVAAAGAQADEVRRDDVPGRGRPRRSGRRRAALAEIRLAAALPEPPIALLEP